MKKSNKNLQGNTPTIKSRKRIFWEKKNKKEFPLKENKKKETSQC